MSLDWEIAVRRCLILSVAGYLSLDWWTICLGVDCIDPTYKRDASPYPADYIQASKWFRLGSIP